MSTYTHRLVEGKYFKFDGECYKTDKLPTSAKEGTIYRVGGADFPYYRFTNGKWVGQHDCEYEWRLLTPYTKESRKPQRATYTVSSRSESDDDISFIGRIKRSVRNLIYGQPKESVQYYEDEDDSYETWKNPNGEEQILYRHDLWCNNGGAIRDEYINERSSYIDVAFRGRGLPNDVSPQTRLAMTDPKSGRIYGYSITWCTIDEWSALYDSEQKRILDKIREAYEKKTHSTINDKLDFITKNMKSPLSADIDGFYNKPQELDDDGNPIEDYDADDDYYDSPQCIIDEEMPNLYSIAYEIGRLEQIADMHHFYFSSDNIRVIYYLA